MPNRAQSYKINRRKIDSTKHTQYIKIIVTNLHTRTNMLKPRSPKTGIKAQSGRVMLSYQFHNQTNIRRFFLEVKLVF